MENAFLGDQSAVRPAAYEPAPDSRGGFSQPANQPTPPGVTYIARQPQPGDIRNANPNAVPDANARAGVAPQIGVANQNQQAAPIPLDMMAATLAQEFSMLASRMNEQQFAAITGAIQAHPTSQNVREDVQKQIVASMLAMNTVIKLHVAYPKLPVEGIVNDAMGVIERYRGNQQPDSFQKLPSEFMGLAASYVMKHGNPQPLQAAPQAAAPVAMAPQGLQAQPMMSAREMASMPIAANTNVSLAGHQHQGMVAAPQQQALHVS